MKSWHKGVLCAAFLAATLGGAFMSSNMQVVADVNGQKDSFSYDLKRNPVADTFNGTHFVWTADAKGNTDAFLDRNIGDGTPSDNPLAVDPWVQLPDGASNPRLKFTVAGITVHTADISKGNATQVPAPKAK
jgi:hypothetical protein